MRQRFAIFLALVFALLPGIAWSQEPSLSQTEDLSLEVKGNVKTVQVDKAIIVKIDMTLVSSFPFTIHAPPNQGLYFWTYPAGVTAVDKGDRLEVAAAPKGNMTVQVKVITADLDKDGRFKGFITKFGSVQFAVGEVPPGPIPPIPPDPKPPVPPEPEPTPAPINADGLHVMIIFESADKAKMPKGQFDIIYGLEMRQWLKANCTSDPQSGDKKAYWIVDKDESLKALDKKWQDAMARPRQSIPWIVISNRGKGGYEGELPADTQAAIKLLEKYK